jgi:hypothetical protein
VRLVDHAQRLDGTGAPVLGVRLIDVEAVDVETGDVDIGAPVVIQWARTRPRPPPVRMPIELSPAATK